MEQKEFNRLLGEKIKLLMEQEKMSKEQAVAVAYHVLSKGHDAISVVQVTSAGTYQYDSGPMEKEWDELKKAFPGDRAYVCTRKHEDGLESAWGVLYDCTLDEENKRVLGLLYTTEKLADGAGVSIGFDFTPVTIGGNVKQRNMDVHHLAASNDLVPRGANNRKLGGDNMDEKDKAIDSLTKERDGLQAKLDAADAKIAAFEKEKRDELVAKIKARSTATHEWDAMSIEELERHLATLAGVPASTPATDGYVSTSLFKELRGA